MLVAMREGTNLEYMHQDHLSSTSVMTDDSGDSLGAIKYLPYGETRSGSVPTDKQFTGQRLDDTGLYYYNARYYDPLIGRFISADTIVPSPANPQSFNRYNYCYNNPLKYVDPSGYKVVFVPSQPYDETNYLSIVRAYEEVGQIVEAWEIINDILPELTQELIDTETIIEIYWDPELEGTDVLGHAPPGSIGLNRSKLEDNINKLAEILAHESFHQGMDIHGFSHNSFYEEAGAFSIQEAVSHALGWGAWFPFDIIDSNPLNDLKPSWSRARVRNYLRKLDWITQYGDKCWDDKNGEYYYYPALSEGGYSLMHDLYVKYYPD